MQWLWEYFGKQSNSFVVTVALILTVIIGVINHFTSKELSFLVFYIIPVFMGTWFIGTWAGVVLSVCCAITWAFANNVFNHSYDHAYIPYWNFTMYAGFLIATTYYLKLLKKSQEQERQVASTDFMTRAVSRRYFLELAESEIDRARRYTHPFTAVYIDIDNFKTINDTFGHDIGDELLLRVVATIKEQIRSSDIIARLGGDEFMIFFPETGAEMAIAAIEKVKKVLLLAMSKNNWPVTFSFGMVTFATPPWSVDHMIKLTDDLMYEGKKAGKNMIKHTVYRS